MSMKIFYQTLLSMTLCLSQTPVYSNAVNEKQSTLAELMKVGEAQYNIYCAGCHQKDGSGMPLDAPALKKGTYASSYITIDKPASRHIDLVLQGVPGTAMIGYAKLLANDALAAIITYERNAWANNTGDVIQPNEIEMERKKLEKVIIEPNKTMTINELMQRGESTYRTYCARCHQLDGSGKAPNGPSLLTSWVAKDPELISHKIHLLLKGAAGTRMRSYANQLNDNELAAVLTYVANAWQNKAGQMIQPNDIALARKKIAMEESQPNTNRQMTFDELMREGRLVYKSNCIRCHQANGEAMKVRGIPALKGSIIATQKPFTKHIDIILTGVAGSIMRAFGPRLNDEEIAAVATYERNAFGNNTKDIVQPDNVATERKRLEKVIEYQKIHQLQQQLERDEKLKKE